MKTRAARSSVLWGVVAGVLAVSCSGKAADHDGPRSRASVSGAAKTREGRSIAAEREFHVAWSVWTGWMPFKLMEAKGFLARRAADKGLRVKLIEFPAYMDSVTAFVAGKLDGCAITAMDALQPAAAGVDTVAIVVNDTSNGGDGVLVRGIDDLRGLKGKEILLAESSVSHYLLVRGLASVGMTEADVRIKNTDGDVAGKAFVADPRLEAVATWNPHLIQATEAGKGKVIFSSKQIPGEIIDLLVVNGSSLDEAPQLAEVLTEAWYDAMRAIEDPATRAESIAIMAAGAHASVEELEKMMSGTELFTDRTRAAAFLEADTTRATMENIKKFSIDHGLVKDTHFAIGVGARATGKLRFDASYAAGR
ncbi:MAG TPA: ABC transporter substrate-binding protein [Kofleriaceae bacterium]|nr:ABC transporter substrate-binding protein [Kofleriaceae bacterium]